MMTRLGRFCLVSAMFLFALVSVALAAAKPKPVQDLPMTFILVRNGDCKVTCVQWISAEGGITADTPRQFERFQRKLKGQGLPVVFQSYGGDVGGAIALGHMIRAAGLETAVGRTQLNGCPMLVPRCPEKIVKNGWSEGEVYSGGSYCYSACPVALAGGRVRAAAVDAWIGLHQATIIGKKRRPQTGRRNLDEISTDSDQALKRILSAYLDEMGVNSADAFAMMGLAAPEGLHFLRIEEEALKSGILT
ncbi:MAG: hypothetical protein JF594_30775, partial [Rhizobium leguminosarum]|nr:hypothetical protein [Rhizobium leguminosarum]